MQILAINGPKRDLSAVKGPKNKVHRRFVSSCYTRKLSNGETSERKWLVYSKEENLLVIPSIMLILIISGGQEICPDSALDMTSLKPREQEGHRWREPLRLHHHHHLQSLQMIK